MRSELLSTVITMCPSGDEMAVSCAFAEKQRSNAESMQKILVLMLGLFVVLSRIYSKMISVAKKILQYSLYLHRMRYCVFFAFCV